MRRPFPAGGRGSLQGGSHLLADGHDVGAAFLHGHFAQDDRFTRGVELGNPARVRRGRVGPVGRAGDHVVVDGLVHLHAEALALGQVRLDGLIDLVADGQAAHGLVAHHRDKQRKDQLQRHGHDHELQRRQERALNQKVHCEDVDVVLQPDPVRVLKEAVVRKGPVDESGIFNKLLNVITIFDYTNWIFTGCSHDFLHKSSAIPQKIQRRRGFSPTSASPSPAALLLRASSARADGPARAAHWVKNSRRTALIFSPPSPENLHKKFLQIPAIRGIVICVIRNGWRWKKRIWGISTVGSAQRSQC